MFLAVFISGSYEFCSDGKGSLCTLHVGYLDKDKFPNNIYYKRWEHEALSEDDASWKEWLEMGSESHEKL